MANLYPFHAIRYHESAGDFKTLISTFNETPRQIDRDYLTSNNEYNIANLTLPEQLSEDRSKFVCYARSAALLKEWLNKGILYTENKPAFYRYTQQFQIDKLPEVFNRTSLIALLEIEDAADSLVYPHEQVFPQYCQDRLRLLEATQTHFETILCLYEDKASKGYSWINSLNTLDEFTWNSEKNLTNTLEKIQDDIYSRAILEFFRTKKLVIADGHHRYNSTLMFHNLYPKLKGGKYIPVALTSLHDPGLFIQPFHRMVSKLNINTDQLLNILSTNFNIEKFNSTNIQATINDIKNGKNNVFGIKHKNVKYIITLKNPREVQNFYMDDIDDIVAKLDVSILHQFIFKHLLKLKPAHPISYFKNIKELDKYNSDTDLIFYCASPNIKQITDIAYNHKIMPQKSTYFYPKIPGGILIWNMSHL